MDFITGKETSVFVPPLAVMSKSILGERERKSRYIPIMCCTNSFLLSAFSINKRWDSGFSSSSSLRALMPSLSSVLRGSQPRVTYVRM